MTDEAEDGGPGRKPAKAAKKLPVKQTAARKAAAKRVVPRKAAAPAAGPKRAQTAKAPVKGTALKKAPVKKVVVKEAPAQKAAAPTAAAPKRAPAAKKATEPERAPAARTLAAPATTPPPPPPPLPPPVPDPPPQQWPAPQWPPPAWPPPPPNARPREGLATGALVTGIVSIPLVITVFGSGLVGLVAIVLAVAALSRIRANPERSGRGLAIAGLVTGVVGVGLTVLVLALPDDGDDNDLGTVSYLDLEPGDCYEREFPLFAGVTLEDCALPHDREVVGAVEHPDPVDAPFPGRQALERKALELCGPVYDAYLGPGADRALFVQQNLQPTRGAWREGNRTIVCSVERADRRPLVGSVKDGGGVLNR